MFLATGQEDGVEEGEGGGAAGGVVKTQAGVPFCPALHVSSSSTHNSTTQRDKR